MQNKRQNNFAIKPLLSGFFGFSIAFSTCVSAEPLTLSEVPLQATGKVEPNLIIMMDSSGSMAWELDSENDAATPEESRLGIAKEAAKSVVRGLGDLRVGLAQFNGSNGARMLKGLTNISETGARQDLLDKIDAISAGGNTPLAEALADLGRYYVEGYPSQNVTMHPGEDSEAVATASAVLGSGPDMNGVAVPGTGEDAAIQQYCQSNFVLMLTDGLPTSDSARSDSLKDYDQDGNEDGSDALDDVAKALFDIDWRPDLTDPSDPDHKNNITSYFVGFAAEELADNALLESAGAQGGGSYQFADSAASLVTSLNDAVNAISNSVGTQASVAFNSTSLDIGSVIYSAKFDTSDFSGRLYARSLNPDTGRIQSTLWEASEELSDETSSSREIITYYGGVGVPFAATNSGVDGNPTDSPHEDDLNFNDTTGAADAAWADRLSYLRGDTANDGTGSFRQRGNFSALVDNLTGPKLLGDIVHSTPIYVGKPELNWPSTFGGNNTSESYEQFRIDEQDRTPMVYVGANDGMLHGFNAETGEEVFGYVPSLVLDSARYEGLHSFTHSDYAHNYYVDLTPTVSDIYINVDTTGNQDEWVTVLVGGLRGGGQGYFALNVTDPDNLDEAHASDVVLWEFDGGSDSAYLGQSYSEAQIAKLNNGKWAVIFGNGYNSDNGEAGLFVVYIEDGIDGTWAAGDWKFIPTGEGTDAAGRKNGLSSPRLIDLNGDRVVDRVYAGDLMGNMWSFDLSATSEDSWGVYGDKALFSAGADAGEPDRAILAAPLVARNTATTGAGANVLVMFGTGQYLNSGDLTDNGAGGFYAVWDNDHTVNNPSIVASDLALKALTTDGVARLIDTDNSDTLNWAVHHGWKMDLDTGNVDSTGYAGERVISAATLRRNTLFFSTVIPNPLPCASSGSGYLMSLDFRSGEANDDAVADFNGDGEINAEDDGYVGIAFTGCVGGGCDEDGDGPVGDPGMPGQSGFIGDVRCTPGSSGDVLCDDIDVGDEEREGRLSWEEFSPR